MKILEAHQSETPSTWRDITTHWYQMDPYWDLVPRYEDTGLQHYSGCQAYEKAPFWKNFTIIADL